MQINPTTMLFEDLTEGECRVLRNAMEQLVIHGKITDEARSYFETWRVACGMDDRQGLLMMSTAFPQRVLLSLLRHQN